MSIYIFLDRCNKITNNIPLIVRKTKTSGRGWLWWPALGHLKIRKRVRQKQTENKHTYRERNY